MRYDDGGDPEGSRKRLRAGVYALFGDDRNLAGSSRRSCSRLAARLPWPHTSNCWRRAGFARLSRGRGRALVGDRCRGNYDLYMSAHDRALAEKRFHFAVGARERLAHHAMLFGESRSRETRSKMRCVSRCCTVSRMVFALLGGGRAFSPRYRRLRTRRAALGAREAARAQPRSDRTAGAGRRGGSHRSGAMRPLKSGPRGDPRDRAVLGGPGQRDRRNHRAAHRRALDARRCRLDGAAAGVAAGRAEPHGSRALLAGGALRRDRRGPARRRIARGARRPKPQIHRRTLCSRRRIYFFAEASGPLGSIKPAMRRVPSMRWACGAG